jgi:hypothetical protein
MLRYRKRPHRTIAEQASGSLVPGRTSLLLFPMAAVLPRSPILDASFIVTLRHDRVMCALPGVEAALQRVHVGPAEVRELSCHTGT